MELRWIKHREETTSEIGVAFVTANDEKLLGAVGYYHCNDEDVTDDDLDGALVEIWKPFFSRRIEEE